MPGQRSLRDYLVLGLRFDEETEAQRKLVPCKPPHELELKCSLEPQPVLVPLRRCWEALQVCGRAGEYSWGC